MDDPDSEKKIPKPYILTADGLSYAENFQPKEENDKKSVKSKKVRTKAKSNYAGINVDELHLDNYPDVKSLKDFLKK